jgi:hypothetical protein
LTLLFISAFGFASCQKADWRQTAISDAERAVRLEAGDSGGTFSVVQITGDQSSGQVCGKVIARNGSILSGSQARFIFYIDGAGGNNPWVEGNPGPHKAPNFDFNWNEDCVLEGYSS